MDSQDAVDRVCWGVSELALVKAGMKVTGTAATIAAILGLLSRLVPHDPVDAAHAGHAVLVTDTLRQQSVSDLPGEHGGVLLLVFADSIHDWRCGNLGFAATDDTSLEVASLVVS